MNTEKWPPIDRGTKVKTTTGPNTPDSEWSAEARANRRWGVEGTITGHHDSHGLCYEVEHTDGTTGCYDPSELEIVPPHQPLMDIPKDKTYPADAVQCGDCCGYGCTTCDDKGWLTPNTHPKGRKCEREECGKPIAPDHVAVYCTNECARLDA